MRQSIPFLASTALILLLSTSIGFAQEGKISGQVVDAETGVSIPGVNVVVVGTQKGASTGPEGRYTILNVPPGTHTLRASFVGYETTTVEGVEVNLNLTTTVDIELREEAVGLDEVVVQAEDRVVQQDLSASRVDVTAENIESLPVSDVQSVVGLQAGVQGLQIRGSEATETDFRVDGATLNGTRDQEPFSSIPLTSVEQVQVQSGGFEAEFGNFRSGIVNVTTKTASRDEYEADVVARYSPAASKSFGRDPNDPDSYWMRPYLDPEVAFEGTDVWPNDLQRQFPDFRGFNELASERDDLTPEQAQELFKFRHRKDLTIDSPDWILDGTISGPMPGISSYLGDLRFVASYRQKDSQYMVPLSEDGYNEYTARLKLTTDITPTLQLNVQGMRAEQDGQNQESPRTGPTRIRRDDDRGAIRNFGGNVNLPLTGSICDSECLIFGEGELSESTIDRYMLSAKINHTISDNTFYEASVQWYKTEYRTGPTRPRDTSTVTTFGGFEADEAPLGFSFESVNSLTGMRMGGHFGEFRDTTDVTDWIGEVEVTSQIGDFNEVKGGIQARISNQSVDYSYEDFLFTPTDTRASWNETQIYGAAFLQDKLEFEGMIANVGVRVEYFDPNTEAFVFSRYPEEFLGRFAPEMDEILETRDVEPDITVSPRVGVSFPITDKNKIFFNYGHFYQQLQPDDLYEIQRSQITNGVSEIANPFVARPKTISYEVGYEQSLFDQYLFRLAGYYKSLKNQPRSVQFENRNGLVSYTTNTSENYEDIRGFEISLRKNRGDWFRGFVSYTYDVRADGNFGLSQFFENRVEQREFERQTTDRLQEKPEPQPFGRISLTFLTPSDFGMGSLGPKVLGNWRVNLLGQWHTGSRFTFTNDFDTDAVEDNIRWTPYRMVDLKISKSLSRSGVSAKIFAQINNIFNIENFNQGSFVGPRDFENYMNSLHLPEEAVEGWLENYEPRDENGNPIFGDDQPGDIDKDHIDPPNAHAFHHLFPREVTFGLRLSF